jgi:predicted nucleotidyltransferase
MKILAKYLGGSYSYGLNTPSSDIDDRYVFIHDEPSKIFGLERHDHQSKQTAEEDSFGWELRHFLFLLSNGNTMCLEMLYNEKWIEITDEFKHIQSYKDKLIDSHKLFKCLKGYCFSEKRLVLGERTGLLGSKRKQSLDKYGYSHKNLVQYLRLCLCGKIFFQSGIFPVNIRKYDLDDILFKIKTTPGIYNKEDILSLMDMYEKNLIESYNNIKVIYEYDKNVANKICYDLYMPILNSIKL